MLSALSFAETSINATVDRNKIYETDTLNLIVIGNVDLEFSFGGLLNFGRNQVTAPELVGMESDFEILDQQQKYNMQSINGKTTTEVMWNYTLAPIRSGNLRIPSIEYQGASTEAIDVIVVKGKAPVNADNPPQVFLEVEVDKSSAYVQEQVLYTIRLYAADQLLSGDLSQPQPLDAIVESLGETNKFYRMAYNQRYEVREKKYLIFPQKSGELTIEPQSFAGMLINTRSRQRIRVREASDAVTVNVKAPPASFSGDVWLPATSLELREQWESKPEDIKVGDSLTRTIEISALGLLGSALPPIPLDEVKGMKVYPDQPVTESYEHDSGAQSLRKETTAFVAIQSMPTTLPEIRIPWWDTVNDVERTAIIPARPFNIGTSAIAGTPSTPSLPASYIETKPQTEEDTSKESVDTELESTGQNVNDSSDDNADDTKWYAIFVLLLSGWALTTLLLLRRQQAPNDDFKSDLDSQSELPALITAINANDPNMPKLLLSWLSHVEHKQQSISSVQDLVNSEALLYQQLSAFETSLYAEGNGPTASEYDKNLVLKRVKELAKVSSPKQTKTPLRPFYP